MDCSSDLSGLRELLLKQDGDAFATSKGVRHQIKNINNMNLS